MSGRRLGLRPDIGSTSRVCWDAAKTPRCPYVGLPLEQCLVFAGEGAKTGVSHFILKNPDRYGCVWV